MTTIIPPSVIPLIPPGELFNRLSSDSTINIRWLTAADPAYFDAINRPIVDVAVRQFIIAKSVDQLGLRLGHLSLFPFLIPPRLVTGSGTQVDLPLAWIWDLHASMPQKWEYVRLAKIKRLNGTNGSAGYTGRLQLIFTAQVKGSINEVSVYSAEYTIDSPLTYQISRIHVPTIAEEPVVVDPSESSTIDGFIEFRTLDTTDPGVQTFLDSLVPGPIPTTYEIADNLPGGSAGDDYSLTSIPHGTGLLTSSASNLIPAMESDPNVWLESFNHPFRINASRTSTTPTSAPIMIPKGLFYEFDVCAPASDQPTGDTTGKYSPVWVNRIVRVDPGANDIKFIFATFNTTDQSSTMPIEFAELLLSRTMVANTVLEIVPIDNLLLATGSAIDKFMQGFGKGHVVLSSKWGGSTSEIEQFFDSLVPIIDDPPAAVFLQESTILSSFAISRNPKTVPTYGEAEALKGSTARRATPVYPSETNRYVNEQDRGKGDTVDFNAQAIPPNVDIERYGFKGGLVRRFVTLIVNAAGTNHDYSTNILPRLRILLGGDPVAGDQWFDGVRIKTFVETGDGPGVWIG